MEGEKYQQKRVLVVSFLDKVRERLDKPLNNLPNLRRRRSSPGFTLPKQSFRRNHRIALLAVFLFVVMAAAFSVQRFSPEQVEAIDGAPTITDVQPSKGSVSGGGNVIITGTNFFVGTEQPSTLPIADFSYTGSAQAYTAAESGTYKLEVWGGQGGDSGLGAKGGYSVGTISLTSGTSLGIYVGAGDTISGIWNGGGVGSGTGGGDASDMRVGGSALTNRIIVAGGGGGKIFEAGEPGIGGGLIGGNWVNGSMQCTGGTQNSGGTSTFGTTGSFGQAGANYSGGGGGWYGGGAGYNGCGGSGYVFTEASDKTGYGVNLPDIKYYLSDAQTIAGDTSFPAPGGGSEIGHSGNGYARITPLTATTIEPAVSSVKFGDVEAASFNVNSDGQITAVAPPHDSGTVDVTITMNDSQTVTLTDGYTYYHKLPPTTITDVGPNSGLVIGGEDVTITGTNFLYEHGIQIAQVAAGNNSFSLVLDTNGDVWSWGNNRYGQLGNATNSGSNYANPTPTKVVSSVKFSQIAAGYNHSLAIDTNGDIWAWGHNLYGQLGVATNSGTNAPVTAPNKVTSDVKFAQIVAGHYHSMAIDTNGDTWAWGSNQYGQLGNASSANDPHPVPDRVDSAVQFSQISAGWVHSVALDDNGDVWTWGSNRYGQLGNTTNSGTTNSNPVPTKVDIGVDFGQISGGYNHSLALDTNGDVWGWGHNQYGQLGNTTNNGSLNPNPAPTKMISSVKFSKISAGYYHSMAIDNSNGDAWAWGHNLYGQLGNTENVGTTTPNPAPLKVITNAKFSQIAAGYHSSLAIDETDIEAWSWGWNYYGQLGYLTNVGTTVANPNPTKVFLSSETFTSGAVTSITFGGETCTDLVIVSNTKATCVTPAHAAGTVDVTAITVENQTATLEDGFTYFDPIVILGISPASGISAGGTEVTITGTGFTPDTTVEFDGVAATTVTFVDSETLTVITPAHSIGAVDVTASNGVSSDTLADGFKYTPSASLSVSKDNVKITTSPSNANDEPATDFIIATVETDSPTGYELNMTEGPDGSTLLCDDNTTPLVVTTADGSAQLNMNSWGVGIGTNNDLPNSWRTVSNMPLLLGQSASSGTFASYLYFGARIDSLQKPCVYKGKVIITAVAKP